MTPSPRVQRTRSSTFEPSSRRGLLLGIVLLAAALATLSCVRSSSVTIRNSAAVDLRNVVVSGKDFRVECPLVRAGESVTLRARITADSGVAVEFDVEDRHRSVPEQGYVTGGGMAVVVEVGSDLAVSVTSRTTYS